MLLNKLKIGETKIFAGHDVEVDTMYLSLVPKDKAVFNSDTWKQINNTYVPVKDLDGGTFDHAASLGEHNTTRGISYQQEKMGWKPESVISLKIAKGSNKAYLAALQKELKGFTVIELDNYRKAEVQKV
jgi:hypothetical protein